MTQSRSCKENHRYKNLHIEDCRRSLWDVWKWKRGAFDDLSSPTKAPPGFTYPFTVEPADFTKPYVVWINHNTFLIHVEGVHFLTDPIWSQYCSPLHFSALRRLHKPGLLMQGLPAIDYVLISHDHYDHLDKKTIRFLHKKYPKINWIVPKDLKKWVQRRGIQRVVELDWWEEVRYTVSAELSITVHAVPAQHYSGRLSTCSNKTLWAGFVVEIQKKEKIKRFYFVGDSGYNPFDFKEIGQKWKKMDLSIIPIGCYLPRNFMQPVHMNPQESVQLHKDVHSELSLAAHWKTFRLADEDMAQPTYDLYKAMVAQRLSFKEFLATQPGQYVNW